MVTKQESRTLLIKDVLDRYERTWYELAISRDRAQKILKENLGSFLK